MDGAEHAGKKDLKKSRDKEKLSIRTKRKNLKRNKPLVWRVKQRMSRLKRKQRKRKDRR